MPNRHERSRTSFAVSTGILNSGTTRSLPRAFARGATGMDGGGTSRTDILAVSTLLGKQWRLRKRWLAAAVLRLLFYGIRKRRWQKLLYRQSENEEALTENEFSGFPPSERQIVASTW